MPESESDTNDPMADLQRALTEDDPLSLLTLASAMLNAVDPRNQDRFGGEEPDELPPLSELLSALAGSGPDTATLAWVMAELSGVDLFPTQVARELGARVSQLPGWVRRLDRVEVVAAEQVLDVLRDNANFMLQARLDGADVTVVTLVDFNLGTVVKDSFVVPESLGPLRQAWTEHADREGMVLEPLPLADARARISHAIEIGAMTYPPLESEQWPAIRPLLEWLLAHLPDDGAGFDRVEWSESDRHALARRFLASPAGAALTRPEDREIVGDLLWYRTDYGYGDPLRWSPAAVEILLLDWYPRKIVVEQDYLLRMPTVLRAFVAFGHAELDIPARLTEDTLARDRRP